MSAETGDCTVLVLSKNRKQFLERLILYLGTDRKFPVIVMDGSALGNIPTLPFLNQNISYFYNGEDLTISRFIEKTIKGLSMVKTNYVVLASDDDFFSDVAIQHSVEFLEQNKEYIAHSNLALDFSLVSKGGEEVYGEVKDIRLWNLSRKNDSGNSGARLLSYLTNKGSLWHAVVRSDAMRETWQRIKEAAPKRFETVEILLNVMLARLGRAESERTQILLFHQVHDAMISRSIMSDSLLAKDVVWREEFISCMKSILDICQFEDVKSPTDYLALFLENPLSPENPLRRFTRKTRSFIIYRCWPKRYHVQVSKNKLAQVEVQLPPSQLQFWKDLKCFLGRKRELNMNVELL